MAEIWTSAVISLSNGTIEFTSKGEAAIQAIFRSLDIDGSKGLNYDEFRTYLSVTEGANLEQKQFDELGLHKTFLGEISLEGFRDIYMAIYEGVGIAKVEERIQSDLTVLGLEHMLKAKNAASLLMSRKKEIPVT